MKPGFITIDKCDPSK